MSFRSVACREHMFMEACFPEPMSILVAHADVRHRALTAVGCGQSGEQIVGVRKLKTIQDQISTTSCRSERYPRCWPDQRRASSGFVPACLLGSASRTCLR